jgi:acetyl esterase/lipase
MSCYLGGNIIAVIAQKLLEQHELNQPKLQVLIYPPTQMANTRLPSYLKYKNLSLFGLSGIKFNVINNTFLKNNF